MCGRRPRRAGTLWSLHSSLLQTELLQNTKTVSEVVKETVGGSASQQDPKPGPAGLTFKLAGSGLQEKPAPSARRQHQIQYCVNVIS